jgi:hypothetical protein
MKKILPYLLAMLVANPVLAGTAYRYSDSVTTLRGDAVGGASVYVYQANTTTKVTLYSGPHSAFPTMSNPTSTDGYGRFTFFVEPGTYDLYVYGTNITPYTLQDVRVFSGEGLVIDAIDYGVVPNDGNDDAAGLQAAIDAAEADGGDIVQLPSGVISLSDEVNVTTSISSGGIILRGKGKYSTRLTPSGSGYNMLRFTGSWGGAEDIGFYCVSTDSNVTGLFIGPADTTAVTATADMSYNTFRDLFFYKCANAIVMRPGPYVGGSVGSIYYNVFDAITIHWSKRGIYMADGPNAGATGVNRNQFYSVRIGLGTNTGVQINNGNTNQFFGCSFEEIGTGTSPSAVPTGIVILQGGPVSGRDNNFNTFYGTMFENCTRDVNNYNQWTGLVGHNTTGAKIAFSGDTDRRYPGMLLGSNGATVPNQIQTTYFKSTVNDSAYGAAGVFYGLALPDTGSGFPAKRGSMYMALIGSAGKVYVKYGAADTSWAAIVTNP